MPSSDDRTSVTTRRPIPIIMRSSGVACGHDEAVVGEAGTTSGGQQAAALDAADIQVHMTMPAVTMTTLMTFVREYLGEGPQRRRRVGRRAGGGTAPHRAPARAHRRRLISTPSSMLVASEPARKMVCSGSGIS